MYSNKQVAKIISIYDLIHNAFDFENCDEEDEENELKNRPKIKPVFKNVKTDNKGNKTIEEEPMDIAKYNCRPFSQILNNCKKRTYDWELFPQEIAANQLQQSGGTCYMVSALESLSHIPKLLNYLFDSNFASNKEKFQVNFTQNDGKIEHFIIKNRFATENSNDLKFMKPLEKEAYGIIFEKVWAVIRGGYEQIDGGKGFEVLNKVLGTSSKDLFNKKMGKFEINIKQYIDKKKPSMTYESINKKIQKKQEADIHWQQKIEKIAKEEEKIDPKKVFALIKNSQKNDGAIITTSINTGKKLGHEYSVLGTYSKFNPITNKTKDFIILKNPWRTGDDLEEKIDIVGIENQIQPFKDIIEINRKHYHTGVFYMPKEYYVCKPNYEKYFPEVYNTFNLYKEVANYYQINSNQYFFDVTQGNNLIKTDVISKEKFEYLLKLIQNNDSDFTHVYNKNNLSTIWYDGKYTNSLDNSVFIKDINGTKYNIKKIKDINKFEFDKSEVYKNELNLIEKDGKKYSVIKLTKVNSFDELKPKNNYYKPKEVELEYRSINPLQDDILQMGRFQNEIKEFLRDRYVFVERKDINIITNGVITAFPGINLLSDEYDIDHNHVHNFGKKNNINLFELIGKKFQCNCYYIKGGKTVKYCNKYFTFKKLVYFSNFSYYIDGERKTTPKGKCDYYNLEKETVKVGQENTKGF